MMMMPLAANMPPTPWQTEILVPGLGQGGAAHLAPALLQCVHAGMHVGEAAAIGVERDPRAASPAGRPGDAAGGVGLGNESAGLAARHKAEIFQAVDRQMRKACP
jgi:hypothetical protein